MNSFGIVREFEQKVADYAGSKYAVAVATGTWAIFLSMKRALLNQDVKLVTIPARTFVSVPMAAIQAGLTVRFEDYQWKGTYRLSPLDIVDGALRFTSGMYEGGFHCLSFQARKLLNIGEGGMVLTNNAADAAWIRKAAYSGRGAPTYAIEDIDMIGWQAYMTPEKAARGLHLMEYIPANNPDQHVDYIDLRTCKVFRKAHEHIAII